MVLPAEHRCGQIVGYRERRDDSKLRARPFFPSASVSLPGKVKAAGIFDSSRGRVAACSFQLSGLVWVKPSFLTSSN